MPSLHKQEMNVRHAYVQRISSSFEEKTALVSGNDCSTSINVESHERTSNVVQIEYWAGDKSTNNRVYHVAHWNHV